MLDNQNTGQAIGQAGHATGHGYLVPPPPPKNDAEIIRAGHALLTAKSVLRGEFEQWVAAHCEFTPRSARRYMAAAAQTTPFDDELGWTAIPDNLPEFRGFDPLAQAERAALVRSVADALESEPDKPEDGGTVGALVTTACCVAPHITASELQWAVGEHVKRAEAELRRVEGIAATLARLPADAPLWFTKANQHWHATDDLRDDNDRLEVLNTGCFDARHLYAEMRAFKTECLNKLPSLVRMLCYAPEPIWTTRQEDVEAYRHELQAWLERVPRFLEEHHPDLFNRFEGSTETEGG